jgi:hypothetical protein
VSVPSDPVDALNWAWHHVNGSWWLIGLLGVGIAWTRKRLSDWNRRNALVTGRQTPAAPAQVAKAQPAPAPASYAAAPSYAAAAYAAQPAYAAPARAATPPAPARKLHREGAPAQRAVTPVGRSVDVPVAAASGRWTLAGAFGDPAHARTAIVVAEVLGPPVGLR